MDMPRFERTVTLPSRTETPDDAENDTLDLQPDEYTE